MKPMKTELRDGEWWITGQDLEVECGPYDTKAEAESDRIGMQRTLRLEDKPGFITSDTARGLITKKI